MPKLYFVGHKSFKSKAGNDCFIVNFLTTPRTTQDGKSSYSDIIDIFTDKNRYDNFVKSHKLMDLVELSAEVQGTKVSYNI